MIFETCNSVDIAKGLIEHGVNQLKCFKLWRFQRLCKLLFIAIYIIPFLGAKKEKLRWYFYIYTQINIEL